MRLFRFTRWMIFWMLMVLSGVIFAIDKGRNLSVQLGSGISVPSNWWTLVACFIAMFVFMCGAGAVGYGVIVVLRRAGVQRLSSVQPWSRR